MILCASASLRENKLRPGLPGLWSSTQFSASSVPYNNEHQSGGVDLHKKVVGAPDFVRFLFGFFQGGGR
jgi:hypothetical protein